MVIILEFHEWKKSDPVILSLIDKESEVLLQFLIDPLCLSITLRVVAISTAKNSLRCCQQLTKGLCSDALDACIMVSGKEDTAKLWVFGDVH